MAGFGNLQYLLINAVNIFCQVIYLLIFVRIILSWLPGANRSSIGGFIYNLTEPILGPIRKMIDRSPIGGGMMLDFSPVIALFLMEIIKRIVISIILML